MARRIIPELISPSQAAAVQPAFESVAEQPLNLRFDLKEQAELAKTLLGPGRKIYVDISQDSKVNWRKLQRAAGVQKTKLQQKAALPLPLPSDKTQPFQVPMGRGGGSNIFASVVERLEAGLAMPHEPDSDDTASEPDEPHSNPEPNSEGDSEGGNDEFADYDEDFIDDTEVHEYYGGDWHKPKHTGFYINQGDIEKTDELLMSDEPDKPEPRKRKVKPKQGKAGSPVKTPGKAGAIRQVMGKDGKMRQVRRRVNPDGTAAARKAKLGGEAAANHATPLVASAAAAAAAGQAAHAAVLSSAEAASGNNIVQSAQGMEQVALTPEEDKIPLAMMAGITPAKAPRALTESLPASPAAGPPGAQAPAPARTPQTGKKRAREGTEGGATYEIPADVRALLDQLRNLAEELGLPKEGKEAVEEPAQPGEEKAQKKLPPQLNPLLARLARAAARENDKVPGARTTIANAAYSFLHPWTQKGNMAVRLKKLQDSAQARYDKSRHWLVSAVAHQEPALAGMANSDPSPMGSDDEFATLPATAASQPPPAAADAPAGATAASGSGLSWNKQQEFALHDYVTSILELQGGRDDNPKLYEDIAARSALWGPNSVTSAELQEIYFRNKGLFSEADADGQPRKRPRKARPLSGGVNASATIRSSGPLDETLESKSLAPQQPTQSQAPSETPGQSPSGPSFLPLQPFSAPDPAPGALQQLQDPAAGQTASVQQTAPQLQPQLWAGTGDLLAAVPQASGQEAGGVAGQEVPSASQPAAALQASQAGPLSGQPSGASSQGAQPSQGERGRGPVPPSKQEFLQFGVDHGGDRETLARGLNACRERTIKDITYKVLLVAGPAGLKVAKVAEAAKDMGLVPSDWVSNKNSRSSQISNAIRNTDVFVHVGDHRYAIASFPTVQMVPLKSFPGKRSGDKPAMTEDVELKHEPALVAPLEAYGSGLPNSSLPEIDSHHSHAAGVSSAASKAAPVLPAQGLTQNNVTGPLPPILIAAMNQIGQGQQPVSSTQALLHSDTDEPVQPHQRQGSDDVQGTLPASLVAAMNPGQPATQSLQSLLQADQE